MSAKNTFKYKAPYLQSIEESSPLIKPEQYDLLLLEQARIAQRAMNKQPQTPARAIRVPPAAPPLERQES